MHPTLMPVPQKYSPFTSNLSEHPMLTSQSAIAAVSQASLVAPRDRRTISEPLIPAADFSKAGANCSAVARPATGHANAIWRSVLWFFLEGFALYGASLHWIATIAVTAIATELGVRQRQKQAGGDRQKVIAPVSPAVREVDRHRFFHPGWPVMVRRAIASRRAKWRSEREVRKAVAALSLYDDRTLQDMGVPDRSLIEQIVRDGRDC